MTPEFKVYDSHGDYQAATQEPPAVALLAEHYDGDVRWLHRHKVWSMTDVSPMESFDAVTTLMADRCDALRKRKPPTS
jgi:hypothetical protein